MIRALEPADAEACARLRRAALLDTPLAFASSPADDMASSPETIRESLRRHPDWAMFGAFLPGSPDLAGIVGLRLDHHRKSAHKAHVWGMYVSPSHRRRGLGSALLDAALRHARSLPGVECVHLSVTSAAPSALRLYERAGFTTWGVEPDALRHGADSVAEHHMALRLG